MKNNAVVLFRKLSKLEWDAKRYGEKLSNMRKLYEAQGIDVDLIVDSHDRQLASFSRILKLLTGQLKQTPPVVDSWSFIEGTKESLELLRSADLVVASVGDELATSVARVLENGLLLPINADPLTSEGALLWPSVDLLEEHINLVPNQLSYRLWPRIRAKLDGILLGDAIGDVYIGAKERLHISHYTITAPSGESEKQSSSGIIVTTGAGSTGWYRSSYWHEVSTPKVEQSNFKGAKFIITEPYKGKLSCPLVEFNTTGLLKPKLSLRIRSLMPDGIVVIDNRTSIRFDRDSEVTITAHDNHIEVTSLDLKLVGEHEIFIGNRYRQLISRFLITDTDNKESHHKSSGLIFATATGASKWLNSAEATVSNVASDHVTSFSREEQIFKYIVTEPTNLNYKIVRGSILPNQSMVFKSNMPEGGVISLDSYSNHLFPSGSEVELSFSPLPFKIVTPPSS